jgi:hypothetical protein
VMEIRVSLPPAPSLYAQEVRASRLPILANEQEQIVLLHRQRLFANGFMEIPPQSRKRKFNERRSGAISFRRSTPFTIR